MATANKAAAAEKEELPKSIPIRQGALRRCEEIRNAYRLVLAKETHYEDLLGEEAVRVVAPITPWLTRGDTIEVIDEGGTFFAWLLLVELVPARLVRLVELLKRPLGGQAIDSLEGTGEWRAAWLGWVRGYGVVGPTGAVLRDGLSTRAAAEADAHGRNAPNNVRATFG
jgi:hypothetical protein